MLSPQDAADAVRLQHELDRRCDGFDRWHATMVA